MRSRRSVHSGMTLVELLVVAAVIGLLLAVSVPILKPVLETRKTFDAAQVLSGAFKHARMMSIQKGKSYGIKLVPFTSAPSVSLQLLMQKGGATHFVNNPDVRVKIEAGIIVPYFYNEEKWQRSDTAAELFKEGDIIQFNRLGRLYRIGAEIGDGFALLDSEDPDVSYENLYLPDNPESNDAMEYRITRTLERSLAWLPPVVMPRGMVVDLLFSGGETVNFNGEEKTPENMTPYITPAFSSGDDIVVMFSPAGHVDLIYVNGEPKKVNEMLYFCVGSWDRQLDINGIALAEDGKSNLRTPSSYWVTLHPKTGGTRITENATIRRGNDTPIKQLQDARRFAKEHFFNVGNTP